MSSPHREASESGCFVSPARCPQKNSRARHISITDLARWVNQGEFHTLVSSFSMSHYVTICAIVLGQKLQFSLQCLTRVEVRWTWRQGHRPCLNSNHVDLVSICNSTSRVHLVLLETELQKNGWKTSDPVNCPHYLFCQHGQNHFIITSMGYHGGSIYPCSGHCLHLIVKINIYDTNKSYSLTLNLILNDSVSFPS